MKGVYKMKLENGVLEGEPKYQLSEWKDDVIKLAKLFGKHGYKFRWRQIDGDGEDVLTITRKVERGFAPTMITQVMFFTIRSIKERYPDLEREEKAWVITSESSSSFEMNPIKYNEQKMVFSIF